MPYEALQCWRVARSLGTSATKFVPAVKALFDTDALLTAIALCCWPNASPLIGAPLQLLLMAFIHTIFIDDRALVIAPRRIGFAEFFGIDSCHVLLGRNGAGKTRLLTRIVEMMVQRSGDSDIAMGSDDSNRGYWMTAADRELHGVVFFTALPYRRRIPRVTGRVAEVSPREQDRGKIGDIDVFHQICRHLDVETSLRATIGFNDDVFVDMLLPALIEANRKGGGRYIHPAIDHALLRRVREFSKLSPQFSLDDHAEFELHRRRVRNALIHDLRLKLSSRDGESHSGTIIKYATLQKLASRVRDKIHLGMCFLFWDGVLLGAPPDGAEALRTRYDIIRTRTRRYVSVQASMEVEGDSLHFLVNSNSEANELLQSDTAIHVAWDELSSGMQALIDQFSRIRAGIEQLHQRGIRNILILIDEGDAFLHLD